MPGASQNLGFSYVGTSALVMAANSPGLAAEPAFKLESMLPLRRAVFKGFTPADKYDRNILFDNLFYSYIRDMMVKT
jgi:hypothetical protein